MPSGEKVTHGTWLRRAVEEQLIDPLRSVQIGLRATGSISLGWDLVAGSSRVPYPATGTMAHLITF